MCSVSCTHFTRITRFTTDLLDIFYQCLPFSVSLVHSSFEPIHPQGHHQKPPQVYSSNFERSSPVLKSEYFQYDSGKNSKNQKWFTDTERLNAFSTPTRAKLGQSSQSDNFLLSPWQKDSAIDRGKTQWFLTKRKFILKSGLVFCFSKLRLGDQCVENCTLGNRWDEKEPDLAKVPKLAKAPLTRSVPVQSREARKSFLFQPAPHLHKAKSLQIETSRT